jgi:hypothetical protein
MTSGMRVEACLHILKMREQLMQLLSIGEILVHRGDPSPIICEELSFCGKLWRKVFGLVRSYHSQLRQTDEVLQAAIVESQNDGNLSINDAADSHQSDTASDRHD